MDKNKNKTSYLVSSILAGSITIDDGVKKIFVTATECRSLLKFRWINGVDIDPMKELQKLGIGYQCEERE